MRIFSRTLTSATARCQHAYILPQKFTLERARLFSNYHLLLAHELEQLDAETLKKSLAFWNMAQRNGHFIMLDNGAYELGTAMESETFAKICHMLEPNEIILPDVLYDGDASMQRAEQFCSAYAELFHVSDAKTSDCLPPHLTRKAAVIQFDTRNDPTAPIDMNMLEEQFKFYHRHLGVSTLCIPRHFGHDRVYGRTLFLEQLHQFLHRHSYWLDVFEFHMLGLACVPELEIFPRYYWIRGVDTAAQFVYAYHGCLLCDHADVVTNKSCKRPQMFFDLHTLNSAAQKLLTANVAYTRKIMHQSAQTGWWHFGQ